MGTLILICGIGMVLLASWYHTRILVDDAERKREALERFDDADDERTRDVQGHHGIKEPN